MPKGLPDKKPQIADAIKQIESFLDLKMPNGKTLGQCTMADISQLFTLGELNAIYPNMMFWFRIAAGEGAED